MPLLRASAPVAERFLPLARQSLGMLASPAMIASADIAQLFTTHGPAVLRRARRLLGNTADAEEAVQEIFVRVVRAGHTFQQQSQLTTWLYQITTNYCLNQLRDRRRQRELDAERPGSPDAHVVAATADTLATVRQLLARADTQQAEAATYVFLDGLSHDEAAQLMSVSRRTVGNLLQRFTAWAETQSAMPVGGST